MKIVRPVSEHRLQRLARWARLWLIWAAGLVLTHAGASGPIVDWLKTPLERYLDVLTQFVMMRVVTRALDRIPKRGRETYGPSAPRSAWRRAIIGSRLRRVLRRRDPRARIVALIEALSNLDTLTAAQTRRLALGLTRRRGGVAPAQRDGARMDGIAATPFACADTS